MRERYVYLLLIYYFLQSYSTGICALILLLMTTMLLTAVLGFDAATLFRSLWLTRGDQTPLAVQRQPIS